MKAGATVPQNIGAPMPFAEGRYSVACGRPVRIGGADGSGRGGENGACSGGESVAVVGLMSGRISLDDINAGFDRLHEGSVVRLMVEL